MKKFKLKRNVCGKIWNDGRGKVYQNICENIYQSVANIDIMLKINDEIGRLTYRFTFNVRSYISLDVKKKR